MMKLLKVELMRRKNLLLGAAVAMVIVEGVALYGIYRGGGWNTLAIIMTVLLMIGALLLPILDTVTKLYSDLKHKQGYMLFLTPQGGNRIVWAKAIFGVLEIVASMALLFGCLAISAVALDGFQQGAASALFADLRQQMGDMFFGGRLAVFTGLVALEMFAQMAIAMLAVTVSRVMVRGSSYNWLIALAMYFALAIAVNVVDSLLMVAFGFVGDTLRLINDVSEMGRILAKYFAIGAVVYAVWFIACTIVSGRLASRHVDL
jgi:hypothetical protein